LLLTTTSPARRARYTIAALGVLLLASACGGSTTAPGSESTSQAATSAGSSAAGSAAAGSSSAVEESAPAPLNLNLPTDSTIAATLPDKYKQSGTIVVATDASYAPNEFLAEGSNDPIGWDIDLANALGQVLGLKVTVEPASFDGIIAGINAGRYDMSLSSFTDTKAREESVNFVTYYEVGTSTMVLAGNPQNITTVTDLCGRPVGAENGTTQLALLNDATVDGSVVKACTDAGKPAPIAQGFPKQTDVNSALAAGRIDAYLADTPIVAYAVKQTGDKFEKVGQDQGTAPYGIALPKDPAALTTSVQQAMQKLIDSGAYMKILDNWGVSSGAITTSAVNGATQ
jgi:polar amino acid transport system substrate-binding protein